MTDKPTPQDVDAFLDSTLIGDDPALSAALQASNAAGLPNIAVSSQQGKFLSLLAGAIRRAASSRSAPWAASAPFGWRGARARRAGW